MICRDDPVLIMIWCAAEVRGLVLRGFVCAGVLVRKRSTCERVRIAVRCEITPDPVLSRTNTMAMLPLKPRAYQPGCTSRQWAGHPGARRRHAIDTPSVRGLQGTSTGSVCAYAQARWQLQTAAKRGRSVFGPYRRRRVQTPIRSRGLRRLACGPGRQLQGDHIMAKTDCTRYPGGQGMGDRRVTQPSRRLRECQYVDKVTLVQLVTKLVQLPVCDREGRRGAHVHHAVSITARLRRGDGQRKSWA